MSCYECSRVYDLMERLEVVVLISYHIIGMELGSGNLRSKKVKQVRVKVVLSEPWAAW